MIGLLLALAGALLGVVIVQESVLAQLVGETRTLGLVGGAIFGILAAVCLDLRKRLKNLETKLASRERPSEAPAAEPAPAAKVQPPAAKPASPRSPATATAPPVSVPPAAVGPARPGIFDQAATQVRRWFTEGNVPVKIGVLVSFVGVAALLRYAADQGWLHLPIELRLAAVAMIAIGGLAFGWRRRASHPAFALSLQGGAVGVLVLTVFAAFRLYSLLPAIAAFALLIALVGATGVLAVLQNSLALAVLGLIAGFAAPVLVATGDGNHVVLFSYYALLNLAVFGVARLRAWPLLNRLGFVFTFVVATLWGVLTYRPELYASTQPFLVLFFALYLLIPILQARQARRGDIDVMLVFGLPLVVFPLQVALLEGERLPVAFSALTLAAVYALAAYELIRRRRLRPLGDAYAALAIGLATLAVPFAFSGPTVAVIWAVEGAALVWIGLGQGHRLARLAGLALQALAGGAWVLGFHQFYAGGSPGLSPELLGFVALAAAGTFSAWLYRKQQASVWLVNLLAAWALGWWFFGGSLEIVRQADWRQVPDLFVAFVGLSVLLAAYAQHRITRFVPGWVAALVPAFAIPGAVAQTLAHDSPLHGWGWAAWIVLAAAAWRAQKLLQTATARQRLAIAITVHAALGVMLSVQLIFHAGDHGLGAGWRWLAGGLPLLAICAWLLRFERPPFSPRRLEQPQRWLLQGAAVLALGVGLVCSLPAAGDPRPLSYVPVLNPLELGQIGALMLITISAFASVSARRRFGLLVAGLALVLVSAMTLRAVHHLADVRWSMTSLLGSQVAHAGLSVLWTAIGAGAWAWGSRRGERAVWLAGAVMLGLVLAKLVLIDRMFLSNVAGIVSFLAFGLLSIGLGYFAPAPPARNRVPGLEAKG